MWYELVSEMGLLSQIAPPHIFPKYKMKTF